MTKEGVLEHVKRAQLAHVEWVRKARALMDGKDNKEQYLSIDSKECDFGMWFHRDGQMLNKLSNNPLSCMQNIDSLHIEIHDIYYSIFNIYFSQEEKINFFSKIFTAKKRILSEEERLFVNSQFTKLELVSKELLEELARLERRLEAVSVEKIESLG